MDQPRNLEFAEHMQDHGVMGPHRLPREGDWINADDRVVSPGLCAREGSQKSRGSQITHSQDVLESYFWTAIQPSSLGRALPMH